MTLEQILPHIRAGKKATRKSWMNHVYIVLIDEMLVTETGHPYGFSSLSSLADDWELHNDPSPQEVGSIYRVRLLDKKYLYVDAIKINNNFWMVIETDAHLKILDIDRVISDKLVSVVEELKLVQLDQN